MNRKCLVVLAMCGVFVCGMVFAQQPSSADRLREQLNQPLSIKMENAHIASIIATIVDEYEINVMIDSRVVRPMDESKVDPGVEYVTDGRLPAVNLQGVGLGKGLRAILRPLELDYKIVEKSFLWISTPDRIRHESFEDLETRFYTLNSQYVEDTNASRRTEPAEQVDLVALLRLVTPDVVQPVTGESISFMRYNIDLKQLVVHTTPSHHKRIEQLLALIESN